MTPCPVTEQVGRYLLTCVMPAGHNGEHWCAEIQEVDQ